MDQAHIATNASEPESGTFPLAREIAGDAELEELVRKSAASPIARELEGAIDLQRDAMKRLARCIVQVADLISEKEPEGDMSRLHRLARDVRRARYEMQSVDLALRDLMGREGAFQARGRHTFDVLQTGTEAEVQELRKKMSGGQDGWPPRRPSDALRASSTAAKASVAAAE